MYLRYSDGEIFVYCGLVLCGRQHLYSVLYLSLFHSYLFSVMLYSLALHGVDQHICLLKFLTSKQWSLWMVSRFSIL